MPQHFTRRAALGFFGTAGLALTGALSWPRAAQALDIELAVVKRTLEVNGKPAAVFGLQQPDGTSGLRLKPGKPFRLSLHNNTDEATIVHWHGQTPPYEQDGVMDTNHPMLQAGERRAYDYAPRPGTHWMHSHHGLQEQLLLAAPLIVEETATDIPDAVLLLHDFSFRDPVEILSQLQSAAPPGHAMHAAMERPPAELATLPLSEIAQYQQMLREMIDDGAMDANDVNYDAYLANDRTLADPPIVPVTPGGRLRLRVINAATSTGFMLDLGALRGQLIAVDGTPVQPVGGSRFPLSMAQRLDLLLTIPNAKQSWPVLAVREGERQQTGMILAAPGASVKRLSALAARPAPVLDLNLERRLRAAAPLPEKAIDQTHRVLLTGGMTGYRWSLNGREHGDHTPLSVKQGQRIALEFRNLTMMAHPMHLHGHPFQVVALDGKSLSGAVRDTVLVPVGTTVRVVFDADNPGSWPLHCHNLLHMATGMMTEIVYET